MKMEIKIELILLWTIQPTLLVLVTLVQSEEHLCHLIVVLTDWLSVFNTHRTQSSSHYIHLKLRQV